MFLGDVTVCTYARLAGRKSNLVKWLSWSREMPPCLPHGAMINPAPLARALLFVDLSGVRERVRFSCPAVVRSIDRVNASGGPTPGSHNTGKNGKNDVKERGKDI